MRDEAQRIKVAFPRSWGQNMQRWDLDSGVLNAVLSNTIATSYR